MDGAEKPATPTGSASAHSSQGRPDLTTLATVAGWLVIGAASWYLLKEFAGLLRPLLLAVFLCYIILPVHVRLRRGIPGIASIIVMVSGSVALLFLLALMIHSSVVQLQDDLPRLTRKAQDLIQETKDYFNDYVPWLFSGNGDDTQVEKQRIGKLREIAHNLVGIASDALMEAFVVGFYLLFILMEAGHFRSRVQSAFGAGNGDRILAVAANINQAMASYLHVKVQASLLLALPVGLALWACGVQFAVMWGVLTFIGNFIPYVGSIVAFSLPVMFAFLQLDFGWQPITAGALVLAIHVVMTYLVEPNMVGRGVGLSPLVILAALAFWGLCWGLVGMFLAIPLTVMLKIVLTNVAFTRPFARLLGDEAPKGRESFSGRNEGAQ